MESVDVAKPSLEALAFLLRRKYLWPRGFIWDYTWFGGGPIGLAKAQWFGSDPVNLEEKAVVDHWAAILKTERETIRWLFYHDLCYWYRPLGFPIFPRTLNKITPQLCAREIERRLGIRDRTHYSNLRHQDKEAIQL